MATLLHDSVIYYSKLSTSFQKLSDEKGHGVTYSVGSNRKMFQSLDNPCQTATRTYAPRIRSCQDSKEIYNKNCAHAHKDL